MGRAGFSRGLFLSCFSLCVHGVFLCMFLGPSLFFLKDPSHTGVGPLPTHDTSFSLMTLSLIPCSKAGTFEVLGPGFQHVGSAP
jgi:hypothetical protein